MHALLTESHQPAQRPIAAPLRHARLVLDLGVALHRYGAPSHRLEEAMTRAAQRLGLDGRFFSLPTQVHATFTLPDGSEHNLLRRVAPAEEDLGRLAAVDSLLRDLLLGRRDPTATARALRESEDSEFRQPTLLRLLAHALVAAAAARFFGGAAADLALAALVGLSAGLVERLAREVPQLGPLQVAATATLAGLTAVLGTALLPGQLQTGVVMLAGVILLVPGLSLTVAMTEIATGHQASGTSRLTTAVVQFALIGFGIAVGTRSGERLATALDLPVLAVDTAPEPALWTLLVALVVSPLAIATLLRAAPRDLGWIVLAGWLAYGGARLGSVALDPQLGAALGATLVGAFSNLLARWRDRPALVTFVPGLLLLVPGSLGFRSFTALLDHQVLQGVETAFTMVLVAAGLVAGALLGNLVMPPRRPL